MLTSWNAFTLACLVAGAWRDVATRTIPHVIPAAIAAAGVLHRIVTSGPAGLGYSVLVACSVVATLLPFTARGIVGPADLKLFAALALGLPPLVAYRAVCASVAVGGVLGLLYLFASFLLKCFSGRAPCARNDRETPLRRWIAVELWRVRRGAALPYGVPIAIGSAVIMFTSSGV